MSGGDDAGWDDDEPAYPRAPLPPHERTWRHPSELGPMPTNTAVPVVGRGYLVGGGILGVALVAVLIQLMLPRSGTNLATLDTPEPAALRRSLDTSPLSLLTTMAAPGSTAQVRPLRSTIGDVPAVPTRAANVRTSVSLVARSTPARVTAGTISNRETSAGSWSPYPVDSTLAIDPTTTEAASTPTNEAASTDVLATDAPLPETTTGLSESTTSLEPTSTVEDPSDTTGGTSTTVEVLTGALYGVAVDASTMVVTAVEIDSPAADAGLHVGDRLVRCSGLPIATPADFLTMAASIEPGDTYEITVERDGEQVQLTLQR